MHSACCFLVILSTLVCMISSYAGTSGACDMDFVPNMHGIPGVDCTTGSPPIVDLMQAHKHAESF